MVRSEAGCENLKELELCAKARVGKRREVGSGALASCFGCGWVEEGCCPGSRDPSDGRKVEVASRRGISPSERAEDGVASRRGVSPGDRAEGGVEAEVEVEDET